MYFVFFYEILFENHILHEKVISLKIVIIIIIYWKEGGKYDDELKQIVVLLGFLVHTFIILCI